MNRMFSRSFYVAESPSGGEMCIELLQRDLSCVQLLYQLGAD